MCGLFKGNLTDCFMREYYTISCLPFDQQYNMLCSPFTLLDYRFIRQSLTQSYQQPLMTCDGEGGAVLEVLFRHKKQIKPFCCSSFNIKSCSPSLSFQERHLLSVCQSIFLVDQSRVLYLLESCHQENTKMKNIRWKVGKNWFVWEKRRIV